jgi:hypothetical protein
MAARAARSDPVKALRQEEWAGAPTRFQVVHLHGPAPTCDKGRHMCRNIRTLANLDPPATEDEVRASALQFVRKVSGVARPSRANEAVFARAVEDVAEAARQLLNSLHTSAAPRNRDEEARKARERALRRAR